MSDWKLPWAIEWTGGSGFLSNSRGQLVSVRKLRRFATEAEADAFANELQKNPACSCMLKFELKHVYPWNEPHAEPETEVWID